MDYNISNIHIIEVFENLNDECPICILEKINEDKTIEKILDDLVMNLEFNQKLGNEFSFCTSHFEKLYASHDKLGLALILYDLITKDLARAELEKNELSKASIIDALNKKFANKSKDSKSKNNTPCYLCSNVNMLTERNMESVVRLWSKEEEFKNLYKNTKGFCMKHYRMLLEIASSILKNKDFEDFKNITFEIQKSGVDEVLQNLDWFIKKFDYRYADEPWKNSKDSVKKGIQKLMGNFNDNTNI